MMQEEQVITSISNNFKIITQEKLKDGKVAIVINKEDIFEIANFLYNELEFDYLHCISGVDLSKYPVTNNSQHSPVTSHQLPKTRYQIIYHFYSTKNNKWLVIKVNLKEEEKVASITPLFKTADWQEREIYDLLGIEFVNHPNLKRILLPDEWLGHPLRKDYKKQTPDLKLR